MKYLAYGSNMNLTDMARRCPRARLVGVGFLQDAVLEFRGCATVRPCTQAEKGLTPPVPVAVWEITPSDERRLDCYEGWPRFYRKEVWPATMADGSTLTGMIYLMNVQTGCYPIAPPSPEYYRTISEGYLALGLAAHLEPVLARARNAAAREGGDV